MKTLTGLLALAGLIFTSGCAVREHEYSGAYYGPAESSTGEYRVYRETTVTPAPAPRYYSPRQWDNEQFHYRGY